MSSGLDVNITDYIINFVFCLKGNKPTNVALVLFPIQNLLEANKYTDFIEAGLQKFLMFLCVGRKEVAFIKCLKKCVFSIMSSQEFTES